MRVDIFGFYNGEFIREEVAAFFYMGNDIRCFKEGGGRRGYWGEEGNVMGVMEMVNFFFWESWILKVMLMLTGQRIS